MSNNTTCRCSNNKPNFLKTSRKFNAFKGFAQIKVLFLEIKKLFSIQKKLLCLYKISTENIKYEVKNVSKLRTCNTVNLGYAGLTSITFEHDFATNLLTKKTLWK